MSYHDKLTKPEWSWIRSMGCYNNSQDSNFCKARKAYMKKGVPRNTRSQRQKKIAEKDETYRHFRGERRAHNIVLFSTRDLYQQFLNYRKVCALLLNATNKQRTILDEAADRCNQKVKAQEKKNRTLTMCVCGERWLELYIDA